MPDPSELPALVHKLTLENAELRYELKASNEQLNKTTERVGQLVAALRSVPGAKVPPPGLDHECWQSYQGHMIAQLLATPGGGGGARRLSAKAGSERKKKVGGSSGASPAAARRTPPATPTTAPPPAPSQQQQQQRQPHGTEAAELKASQAAGRVHTRALTVAQREIKSLRQMLRDLGPGELSAGPRPSRTSISLGLGGGTSSTAGLEAVEALASLRSRHQQMALAVQALRRDNRHQRVAVVALCAALAVAERRGAAAGGPPPPGGVSTSLTAGLAALSDTFQGPAEGNLEL